MHSTLRTGFTLLATTFAAASYAPALHAQTAPQQAAPDVRDVFRRANAAYDARDFDTALRLFQQAYIDSERAEFLLNIGQTFMQLGRLDDARASLQRFLQTAPPDAHRADVEEQIRALDVRIAARSSAANSNTTTPPISAPPPRRAPDPIAPPVVATPEPRPLWPWLSLGVGGALGVGSVVLFLVRPDAAACEGSSCNESEFLRRRDSAATLSTTAIVLASVGGAAVLVGAFGAALSGGPSEPASAQRTRVSVTLNGFEVRGAF